MRPSAPKCYSSTFTSFSLVLSCIWIMVQMTVEQSSVPIQRMDQSGPATENITVETKMRTSLEPEAKFNIPWET